MSAEPTLKNFTIRVGGFFCLVLFAILLAKSFFPSYGAYAIPVTCCLGVIYLCIEHVQLRRLSPLAEQALLEDSRIVAGGVPTHIAREGFVFDMGWNFQALRATLLFVVETASHTMAGKVQVIKERGRWVVENIVVEEVDSEEGQG